MKKLQLALSVTGPWSHDAESQIRYHLPSIDKIELRLDLWHSWSLEILKKLRQEFSLPVIYTLRPLRQGGGYKGEEAERYQHLQELLTLCPDYLDVEYDVPQDTLDHLKAQAAHVSPRTAFIHSYHQMPGTKQEDINLIYQILKKRCDEKDYIKIAVTPLNSLEALQLLKWVKDQSDNTLCIGMGEYGIVTRICGQHVGVPWSYVHGDHQQPSAPGQLSCRTLRTLYERPFALKTAFYALLGDPVSHSISQWSHNLFFELFSLSALYLKCKTTPQELKEFLPLARDLGFQGFSITHPLKEAIIPYLDDLDSEARAIGAVNTLRLERGKWVGYNTDGIGALKALEAIKSVKGKRALILGSGGCAKAIAYTLKQQGCDVKIMSRNAETGRRLAQRIEGEWFNWNLDALPNIPYDFLIQATSSHLEITTLQLDSPNKNKVVMETKTAPRESNLIQAARANGYSVVYGHSMFEEQATLQMKHWFHEELMHQDARFDTHLDIWRSQLAKVLLEGVVPDSLPSPL